MKRSVRLMACRIFGAPVLKIAPEQACKKGGCEGRATVGVEGQSRLLRLLTCVTAKCSKVPNTPEILPICHLHSFATFV